MKVNKKTRNVIGFVFAFFSIISIFTFPETHTKFIDKDENALSYNAKLNRLYQGAFDGGIATTKDSTETMAYLTFHFDRNPAVIDDTIDVYEIIVPNVCSLHSISTKGSRNGNKVTFQTKERSTTNVVIRCEVNSLKTTENGIDVLRTPKIQISEKVGTDKNSFIYHEGNFLMSLEDYNNHYKPEEPDPEATITDKKLIMPAAISNKYNTFISWITAYANKSGYANAVLTYVKNKYPDEASILNMNLTLPGLSVTYDATKKNYVYEIKENFIGYARTAEASKTSPQFMYFSTEDKTVLQNAFELYLKTYAPKVSDYQLILDYVKSFDASGISYVVLPDSTGTYQTINGMVYDPATKQLRLLPNLLDYAYLISGTPIRFAFGLTSYMHNAFRSGMLSVYPDIISPTAKGVIEYNLDIYRSITKNGYQTSSDAGKIEPYSFRDYFITFDEEFDHYLLIDVKSLAGSKKEEDQYNYVIFDKLELAKDIQITFKNTSDTILDITIVNQNKENILNAITKLNTYFKTDIKESDLEFVTNDEGNISVTYEVTKEIL